MSGAPTNDPTAGAPAPAPAPAASPAPAPAPAAAVAPAPAPAPAAPVVETAPKVVAEAPKDDKIGEKTPEKPDSGEKPSETVVAADTPTLLEEIADPNAKPGEKSGEKTTTGEKPPETTAQFTFQPYKLPEGVKADDKTIGEFNNVLISDGTPQDRGQKLIDLHIGEMTKYDAQLRDEQQRVFDETRKKWRTEIMSDSELGGSGFNTTKTNVAKMRDLFVSLHPRGSEQHTQELADFNKMLRYTGVGDHPAFWRLMNNVARRFSESPSPPLDIKPPPDIGKRPRSGQSGGRLRDLYTHDSSHVNRSS